MKALVFILATFMGFAAHAENITLACGDAFFQDTDFTIELSENRQEGMIKYRGDRAKYFLNLSAETFVQDDRGNMTWKIYLIDGQKSGHAVALPESLLKNRSKVGGMMTSVFGTAEKALYLQTQKGELVTSDAFGDISCVRTK